MRDATCERAEKQLTALILNVCSERLLGGCDVDVSPEGCSSTNVGDLIDELAMLIFNGECQQAADCAGAVNEGGGLVLGGGAPSAQSRQQSLTPSRTRPLTRKGKLRRR